jgi:hypothetical protein
MPKLHYFIVSNREDVYPESLVSLSGGPELPALMTDHDHLVILSDYLLYLRVLIINRNGLGADLEKLRHLLVTETHQSKV